MRCRESLTSGNEGQHRLQNLPENLWAFFAKALLLLLVPSQGGLKLAQFYIGFPFQNLDTSKYNAAKSVTF